MSNELKITIDLTPFIVEAIISNSKIEEYVSSLYEKHKFRAYALAKDNVYYSHSMLCDGGIKREVYAKRTLGLLLLAREDDEVFDEFLEIIKKGWRNVYNYCYNSDSIDIKVVIEKYTSNSMTEDQFNSIVTITFFLAHVFEKEIAPVDYYDRIIKLFYERLMHYDTNKERFCYENLRNNKELFNKAISIKNRLYETIGKISKVNDIPLFDLKNEYTFFSNTLAFIFDSENVLFTSMLGNDYKIDEKDIIELAAIYYMIYKNQNREQLTRFIIMGLYLKYTIKAYKEIKDYYFQNNKETLYHKMESYDKTIDKLEKENRALKSEIEIFRTENQKLKKDYKLTIEKENIELKKEIEKLKETINELEKDKKELIALREHLFNENEEEIELNEDITIPRVNGIIAGGHSNWHDRIKEVLPDSFKYIEGNNENFDLNILNNAQYVFIYTKYMSHGFYYKLMNKVRNLDVDIYYINSTYPERVKQEIYNHINNNLQSTN